MIQLSEEHISLLRRLVSFDPGEIEAEFDDKIASNRIDIKKLGEFKLFLADKLLTASETYTGRIKKLIDLIDNELRNREETSPVVENLCAKLTELSKEKSCIEDEINELKMSLSSYLNRGKRVVGNYQISFYPGFPYLGVVNKSLIPVEFTTPQPDRKKLMGWFESKSEIVPGTEIRMRKDVLVVKELRQTP
jgi:hypothetical protein